MTEGAFTMDVTPAGHDIDGLNHTNNAVYVRWCETIAWAHSARLGLDLDDYRRLDRAMAIRRSEYDYVVPTRLGEPLVLATWLLPGDKRVVMERCFHLVRRSDNATVMRGRWELACIDISTGRVRRMPPEFIAAYVEAAFGQPEQG